MTAIIGLTGSIGMGKTTVARQFRHSGAVVSDADAIAHQLMQPEKTAFIAIVARFPQVVQNAHIDRQKLGHIVFDNPNELHWLEELLHPLVRDAHQHAIIRAQRERRPAIILEVPLLFETGLDSLCDMVCVVSCPAFIQQQRVLRRPGMTVEKLSRILARQLPDALKRRKADMVIPTGLGTAVSRRYVGGVMREVFDTISE